MNKVIKISSEYNKNFNLLLEKYFNMKITDFKEDTQYYAIFKENIKNWNNINEIDNKLISLGRTCFNFNRWKYTQNIPKNIEIDKDYIFFTGIYTKPEYRKQGFGKKLLLFRLQEGKNYKIFSDVRKNSSLLKIYYKYGFKKICECKDKISYCLIKK